jgi:hypothetical protein
LQLRASKANGAVIEGAVLECEPRVLPVHIAKPYRES